MANIVICADGTWNGPEEDVEKHFPTNVLRIARAIKPSIGNTLKQHVFYDWGLGSYHSKVMAGATGRGIHKNILDGYRYIVQNYAANDKIYLFGFSRGAYTVRALCGLINNCGIVKRPEANLITEAFRIYKHPGKKYHPDGHASLQFRKDFSHPSKKVHFVGVFDTVGALGIPFSLMGLLDSDDEFYDTKMGSNLSIARHAIAIDEQRRDFAPTIWNQKSTVDLKQVWFAGSHSDVGGSYPPDTKTGIRASDTPLEWMLDQAKSAGLALEAHVRSDLTNGVEGKIHRSRKHVYRLRRPLQRDLIIPEKPTMLHPSVRLRYESDPNYRPKKLKQLVDTYGWDHINVGT